MELHMDPISEEGVYGCWGWVAECHSDLGYGPRKQAFIMFSILDGTPFLRAFLEVNPEMCLSHPIRGGNVEMLSDDPEMLRYLVWDYSTGQPRYFAVLISTFDAEISSDFIRRFRQFLATTPPAIDADEQVAQILAYLYILVY
jgi:hypothetical protein